METEKTSRSLALGAGALSLGAFIMYSWKTFIGETQPNISSWAVWSFLTILNFTSYKKLTGDWTKSILPTANAIMTLVTLACAMRYGSFGKLSSIDSTCLIIGLIAGLSWTLTRSALPAQIILQIAIAVGFIPTLIGVWNHPSGELSLAWLFWACAFVAQIAVVNSNWKGERIEFLYPINMFFFHTAVFLIIVIK